MSYKASLFANTPATHVLPSTPDKEFNMDWAISIPESMFEEELGKFLSDVDYHLEAIKRRLYHTARNEYLARKRQGNVRQA